MKLAIPVKTNKENPAVSPLFGKAKWFAIVENGDITIVKNEQEGGHAVIQWLYDMDVDVILAQQLGANPYMIIKKLDINLYHTGFERILLDKLLWKFENDLLTILDDTNIHEVINHHEKKHPAHDEEHHHH
jgi:predicted Fe-Mo cluster-binding NifX family protein